MIERIKELPDRENISQPQLEVHGPFIEHLDTNAVAQGILRILEINYGTHDITPNWRPLAEDIQTGKVVPFVGTLGGKLVACAALIKLDNHIVELGRGAALPNLEGGMSGPIVTAYNSWERGDVFPETKILKGEARAAKPTKEIPGGMAVQVVDFKKLKFYPTGIGPFFHHGTPDRQEPFLLISHPKNREIFSKIANQSRIPDCLFSNVDDRQIFSFFWEKTFKREPAIAQSDSTKFPQSTSLIHRMEGPLQILDFTTPDRNITFNNCRELVEAQFRQGTRFSLARIPLEQEINQSIEHIRFCKRLGFKQVGFDLTVNSRSPKIEIIMGRLSSKGKERLVLPCFAEGVFPHAVEDSLTKVVINWRLPDNPQLR